MNLEKKLLDDLLFVGTQAPCEHRPTSAGMFALEKGRPVQCAYCPGWILPSDRRTSGC